MSLILSPMRRVPAMLIACGLTLAAGAARADEVADDAAPLTDNVAPTVLSCVPSHGGRDVALDSRMTLTFSEEIAPASVTPRTFWVGAPGNTLVPGSINYSGVTATFVPSAKLAPGTTYVTTVTTGVRDLEGNGLSRDYACSFTTVAPPAPVAPVPAPVAPVKSAGEVVVKDRRWYVGALAAYSFPVCDLCVDHGAGWGVFAGKAVADRWNVELSYLSRELDLETEPGVTEERSLGLNGLWFPDRRLRYAPFVLVGAGAHEQQMDGKDKATVPYGTMGVGLLVSPWYGGLAFRLGAQFLRPWGDDYCGKGETLATLGLQLPFGG